MIKVVGLLVVGVFAGLQIVHSGVVWAALCAGEGNRGTVVFIMAWDQGECSKVEMIGVISYMA